MVTKFYFVYVKFNLMLNILYIVACEKLAVGCYKVCCRWRCPERTFLKV